MGEYFGDILSICDWTCLINIFLILTNSVIINNIFSSNEVFWYDFETKITATTVGTDFGYCCLVIPQIIHIPRGNRCEKDEIQANAIQEVRKGSKDGEQNGLTLVLDIENFNFAYHRVSSQGLKAVVHDHRTKPLFEHEGVILEAGKRTQLAILPFLTVTTDDAIDELTPQERQCYKVQR